MKHDSSPFDCAYGECDVEGHSVVVFNSKIYFSRKMEFVKQLGSGSFGDVFLVRKDGRLMALKKPKSKNFDDAIRSEKLIMERLQGGVYINQMLDFVWVCFTVISLYVSFYVSILLLHPPRALA